MNITKIIGDFGENKTAGLYKSKGYTILVRNFKCRLGELDIVAQKGDTVAVIEVKTRKNADFAQAREFVNYNKQSKIKAAAKLFLQQNDLLEKFIRFDVAEVYTENKEINIIEDAF